MEILDFLRMARRRLALLVLVPLLAVGAAVALVLAQPPTYSASATVGSPALIGSAGSRYTGSQGVNQYAATFQATAIGPAVSVAVQEQVGISESALFSGLTVNQQGASPTMIVTFSGERQELVSDVVQAVSAETLRVMFESQVDAESARVEAAREQVTASNAAIATFGEENNVADPNRAYDAQLSQLNALIQQQASLKADGNAVGAAAMAPSITSAQEALARFAPILAGYSNLSVDRDAALAGLTAAQGSLQQATAQLAAADPADVVFVGDATADSRIEPVLRTAAPVGAAALFLSLLLVGLLEVAARGRAARARAGTDETSMPTPGSASAMAAASHARRGHFRQSRAKTKVGSEHTDAGVGKDRTGSSSSPRPSGDAVAASARSSER